MGDDSGIGNIDGGVQTVKKVSRLAAGTKEQDEILPGRVNI